MGEPGSTWRRLWQLVRAEWLAPVQCVLPAGPGEVGGARGLARCWKAVETFLAAGFILTLLVSPMAKSGD